MKLNEYLKTMVTRKDAQKIRMAMKHHLPIIISGVERSGKTTLQRVLRAHGANVQEDFLSVHINLKKTIPEEDCIRDFYQTIE